MANKGINFYVDETLHREFKIALATAGKKQREVLEDAIKEFIEKTHGKSPD